MAAVIAGVIAALPTDVIAMQVEPGPVLQMGRDRLYAMSFRAGLMLQEGEARELVYDGRHKLSELTWDLTGLVLAGGSFSVVIGPCWQFNAGAWTALNKGSGSMENYDWFIPGLDWTHFSNGAVEINSAYMLDLNGTYTFCQGNGFKMYAIAGYKRLFWDWSEYGRTYIYSVNGWRDRSGFLGDVNGIDYQQCFDVPYAGIGGGVNLGRVNISGYLLYSTLVRARDRDHHILRELYFSQVFRNINYIGVGLEGVANLSDTLFISVAWDTHTIPDARGDITVRHQDGQVKFYPGSAGIRNTAVSTAIMAGVRF